MRIRTKIMGLVMLVVAPPLAGSLQAQQIDFYPANPWLVGTQQGSAIQTLGAPHPNSLPDPPIGFGGLFTVSQAVVVWQGIFDNDGVADAIAVPGHVGPAGVTPLGNCLGDLKSSVNFAAISVVPSCVTSACEKKCVPGAPENIKAICDKSCVKIQPVECWEKCNDTFLNTEETAFTGCINVIKGKYQPKYDVCLNNCQAQVQPTLLQCEQDMGCDQLAEEPIKHTCKNDCKELSLNAERSCAIQCITTAEQKCVLDVPCLVKITDPIDKEKLVDACKDVDGQPGWDDFPTCLNVSNDMVFQYPDFATCKSDCEVAHLKPLEELKQCLDMGPASQVAAACQQQCDNLPINDYQAQCSSLNIDPIECTSMLTDNEFQQCLLKPYGLETLTKGELPASCGQEVSSSILLNDGDPDLSDTLLEDNWGPDSLLVVGNIPDPVDSAFPTIGQMNQLFLPSDVTVGNFDFSDTLPESVIINTFPLNKGTLTDLAKKMKSGDKNDQLKFLKEILPTPLPAFLSDPQYQTQAPLFMLLRQGGAVAEYNLENECNTDKAKAPRNCASMPVAVQNVNLANSGADDLAILHQYFSTPSEDINPNIDLPFTGLDKNPATAFLKPLLEAVVSPSLMGKKTAKDYCSNLNGEGFLPGKLPGNDGSQTIDVGYLGLKFSSIGSSSSKIEVDTPVTMEILGYLTSHHNDGQGHFQKWPTADNPYRLCVGKTPVDLVQLNQKDLAVANFGGISPNPLKPELSSLALDVAGGVTIIKNYQGGKDQKEEVLHLPIRPSEGDHFLHPIGMARGDFNGDGYHDFAVTGLDAMGMHLNLNVQSLYQVPDVIQGEVFPVDVVKPENGQVIQEEVNVPDFGGKCNGKSFPHANCPHKAPLDQGLAQYEGISYFDDDQWWCRKLGDKDTNPTYGQEVGFMAGVHGYQLYVCEGIPAEPTCGFKFIRKNATQFVYKASYHVNVDGQAYTDALNKKEFPPANWQCGAKTVQEGVHTWQCNPAPNVLQNWTCQYQDVQPKIPDLLPDEDIHCQGTTKDAGAEAKKFPFDPEVNIPGGPGGLSVIDRTGPIERDAIYVCNSAAPVRRNSEFAVYMNKGESASAQGYKFATSFSNDYPYHHYVDVANNVPRIVPDLPVNFTTGGKPTSANNNKMSSTTKIVVKGAKGDNQMGLGVWPIHAAGADLVNKMGAWVSGGDGCDDLVLALNNSFHVAVLPSQACKLEDGTYKPDKTVLEPFKGAQALYFPSTTPKFKQDMAAFLKGPLDKINAKQPLEPADKLILSLAMMSGTSYVAVPEQPLTAAQEFADIAGRRGIVAIHGFPWRVMIASMNSMEFPASFLKTLVGTFQGMMGGLFQGLGNAQAQPGQQGGGKGCALVPEGF